LTRRDDGTPARGLNESTLAELPDGSLLVNSRHYRDRRPVGRRADTRVTWDSDGEPRPGPVRADPVLVDSGVQGSLLWLPGDGPHGRLLFCNPAHPTARVRLTLRESRDGGAQLADVAAPGGRGGRLQRPRGPGRPGRWVCCSKTAGTGASPSCGWTEVRVPLRFRSATPAR
jgi:hypothetical protein